MAARWEGLSPLLRFGAVGASGLVVNTAALALCTGAVGLSATAGVVVATQVSTTTNFMLSERYVFTGGTGRQGALLRYVQFSAMNNLALLARGPLLVLLTGPLAIHLLWANLLSLVALVLLRFGVADRLIWGRGALASAAAPLAAVATPLEAPAPARRSLQSVPGSTADEDEESRKRASSRRRLRWGASAVIGASAMVLRLVHLNALGFNSDEAVYAGQAASIAGDAQLQPYFPIFRAHPMLFQTTLSVIYQFGTSPLAGRLLSVAFGLGTVVLTYRLGAILYGRRAGAVAALILAVMPYHVIVSRQVLLDTPMVFFATLALLLLARFAQGGQVGALYAASAVLGLTIITNERSLVLLASVYLFLALASPHRLHLRHLAISAVIFVSVVIPYPVSVLFSGKQTTGSQFLAWQLFRRANHDLGFYPSTVPAAIGALVVAAAAAALWRARRAISWRETLLICWMAIPIVYFQLWPVKGFQYLLPVAPVFAVLAARWVTSLGARDWQVGQRTITGLQMALGATVLIAGVGAWNSWTAVDPSAASSSFLAGSGGVPGGREAGEWVRDNSPEGSEFLALGPSMANIIQWYGDRKTYGLSVSSNPLHRNPVYEPISNPDLALRNNKVQYLVWDAYSAGRSSFFSDKLLTFAERYNGRVVHRETVVGSDGEAEPVIVIYEVRP